MDKVGDGARGRTDTSALNQIVVLVQPTQTAHAILRHPAPLLSNLLRALLSAGGLLLIFNEIRGLLVSIPVMLALYQSGGTLMAWWIALCSLGGIALSVIVPAWLLRKVRA